MSLSRRLLQTCATGGTHCRALFALLALALPAFSNAGVVDSRDWLVQQTEHRALTALSTRLGFLDTELPRAHAVAVITVTGCDLSILVVGPVEGRARAYAEILDSWRSREGMAGEVLFSQENDCAAARYRFSESKFGRMSGSLHFDLADLVGSLSRSEASTQIALTAPVWTKIEPGPTAAYTAPNGTKYWNLTAQQGSLRQIVSRVVVASWVPWVLGIWVLLPGMGILIAFGTALLVARKDSIPLPTRRRLYAKIVLSSVVGVIGVHALLVAATLPTRMFDPISQLWFGIRFTSVALLIVPTFVVVPFLALPFMIKQEKKLFGPSPEEVDRLAAMGSTAVAAKVTPPKTVFQRFIPGVMLLLLVAGMYFLTSVDKYSPLARLKPLAPMLLLLCMLPLIITSNRRLNKVNVGQEDRAALEASLQSKIDRLCGPMGLGIVKGRLMPTFPAVRFGASADARGVAVTADAVRELADPELDFLLAHELAHIKLRHIAWRRWMILAPPACFFILFNVAIFGKSLAFVAPAFILSPFLIGLLGMVPWMIVMRRSMLKQEFEADALAIKITGAADSAIAVLKKLALNSPLPGMHEVDTTTHPAIGSRIAAIQGACN